MNAKYLLSILLICFSFPTFSAENSINSSFKGVFHEQYDEFKISGLQYRLAPMGNGAGFNPTFRLAGIFGVNSIESKENGNESYASCEAGIGFRLGSKFYISGEIGFDLLEFAALVLLNKSDDDEDEEDTTDEEDRYISVDVDHYISIGAGMNLGKVDVQAISRYRRISGYSLEDKNVWFSGIEVGFKF